MSTHPSPLARPVRDGLTHARLNSSVALWAGALSAAIVVASALAYDTKVGVGILLAACVVPMAFFRLRAAICVWVVLLFFSRTSAVQAVPNKFLLLIGASWIALLAGRRIDARRTFASNRGIVLCAGAFVVWVLITLAWAPVPGAAERPIKELLYAGFALVLLLRVVAEPRHVRWLATAFVAGAALSVLWGAAKGGLSISGGGEAANAEGRFQGGAGDPNYLAAVLVPALMLAGGLAVRRGAGKRVLLALATMIIAIGLAATQSRGGIIGAGVCAVLALIIWRGRRALILSLIGLAVLATTAFFVANPAAWERIHAGNASGSGRVDIWKVAWRVVQDHPLAGVGIAQFPQVSPHYVLQPGALEYVNLIVEKHIVVHNLYLQLWVETGMVGLLLFLGIVATSVAAGWRAARQFDRQGDLEMSSLARASILALIGMLTASFFLSNLEAGQLWFLLALGPLLSGLAAARARQPVLLMASG